MKHHPALLPLLLLLTDLLQCLFQVSIWRWELLAALLPAMYWAPAAAVFLLLRVLSWRLFTASTAVYFLMGTKARHDRIFP